MKGYVPTVRTTRGFDGIILELRDTPEARTCNEHKRTCVTRDRTYTPLSRHTIKHTEEFSVCMCVCVFVCVCVCAGRLSMRDVLIPQFMDTNTNRPSHMLAFAKTRSSGSVCMCMYRG
jgi:hypothetical protein